MIFNIEQISELGSVIDFYHTFFIGQTVGKDILSKADIKLLNKFGVEVDTMSKGFVEQAYKYGILKTALRDKRTKNLTYEQFKKFIATNNLAPLNNSELESIKFVKQQLYNDIKGLGNRISRDFTQVIIEASKTRRAKNARIIRVETKKAIQMRKSVNELSSVLAKRTGDWSRDFDRIADYVLHSAYQQGAANQLIKDFGVDTKIFYMVKANACKHCIRVYLTDGEGSEPRQFKLIDVMNNGSNIGVKADDYLPSIDPLHPWCHCILAKMPDNGIWDKTKKQFIISRNTYGVNRKSKIKITIS